MRGGGERRAEEEGRRGGVPPPSSWTARHLRRDRYLRVMRKPRAETRLPAPSSAIKRQRRSGAGKLIFIGVDRHVGVVVIDQRVVVVERLGSSIVVVGLGVDVDIGVEVAVVVGVLDRARSTSGLSSGTCAANGNESTSARAAKTRSSLCFMVAPSFGSVCVLEAHLPSLDSHSKADATAVFVAFALAVTGSRSEVRLE